MRGVAVFGIIMTDLTPSRWVYCCDMQGDTRRGRSRQHFLTGHNRTTMVPHYRLHGIHFSWFAYTCCSSPRQPTPSTTDGVARKLEKLKFIFSNV
ncbi:hypothetical protein E2C01_074752 [Portunus trituberculatus]|uniref:Uncharacterized protein n=1 Tax=Portunus trituberculatus TaxID=210409 RepID=A0A5B7I8U9_PORTR|nr:hypothetical protein [Portunus trituberculatus]